MTPRHCAPFHYRFLVSSALDLDSHKATEPTQTFLQDFQKTFEEPIEQGTTTENDDEEAFKRNPRDSGLTSNATSLHRVRLGLILVLLKLEGPKE